MTFISIRLCYYQGCTDMIKPNSCKNIALTFLLISLSMSLVNCGGGSGNAVENANNNNAALSAISNQARYTFNCDLNGANGVLTLDVEAISSSGIVFGSGPNPEITGVIGTGDYTYYTSGTLVSAVASYSFTGENNFADFLDQYSLERFRVQWIASGNDSLVMEINPFGPAPTTHVCELENTSFL